MKFAATVIVLILFLNYFTFGEKILKMYKTECNYNPKYVANGSCSLKIKSRESFVTNVDYDLLINMTDVTVNIVFYKFYNQFRPFLFNEKFKLCNVSNGRLSGLNYYAKTVLRITAKYSNALICHHIVRFLKIILYI